MEPSPGMQGFAQEAISMIAWNFRTYDHEALLGLLGSQDTVNPSTFQPFNFQPFNPSIVELRLAVVPSHLQYLVTELQAG